MATSSRQRIHKHDNHDTWLPALITAAVFIFLASVIFVSYTTYERLNDYNFDNMLLTHTNIHPNAPVLHNEVQN